MQSIHHYTTALTLALNVGVAPVIVQAGADPLVVLDRAPGIHHTRLVAGVLTLGVLASPVTNV